MAATSELTPCRSCDDVWTTATGECEDVAAEPLGPEVPLERRTKPARAGAQANGVLRATEDRVEPGRVAERAIGVRLHLARRDRRPHEATVGIHDRVAGVLPALIHEASAARAHPVQG